MKRLPARICFALTLLAFLQVAVFAQPQLGESTLGSRPTITLQPDVQFTPGEMRLAVRSLDFVESVGGVAFGAIATPVDTSVKELSLSYVHSAPDGQRVKVTIDGGVYTLKVPDWILVPSIEIASTEDIALTSAFGEYADKPATATERCNRYIFSFHAALRDNLVGLRVLQADLIGILPEQYGDLPKIDGTYLLGALESAPTADELSARRKNQSNIFRPNMKYQSYILSDDLVTFSVRDHAISFVGVPVYHFWRTGLDGIDLLDWNRKYAKRFAGLDYLGDSMLTQATHLVDKMIVRLQDIQRRSRDLKRREMLKAEIEQWRTLRVQLFAMPKYKLRETLLNLELQSLAAKVDLLPENENPLLDPARIDASNHTIYTDMTMLSQTLAFFRYVKKTFPMAWNGFALAARSARPIKVRVPTEVPKSESARKDCLARLAKPAWR